MLSQRTLYVWGLALFLTLISAGMMMLRDSVPGLSLFRFEPTRLNEHRRQVLEFLLLLPVAVTIVCFARVVIGISTFGTFAPALLGLAYREEESLGGVFVLLTILFAGWFFRHAVHQLYLLQVPRTSLMLSLVIGMLVILVAIGEQFHFDLFQSLPLFPLVILTGIIERFWSMDEEQGTSASFSTLFISLTLAAIIGLVVRIPWLTQQMLLFPETLGIIMSAQLLMGRYTGYRLLELYRFRSLTEDEECIGCSLGND
jgi:hypothetical protein